jgi:hypothetical protein
MARKPVDPVKLNLRFTEALRQKLERQAAKKNCSINSEIIRRLEQSFAKDANRELEKNQDEKNSEVLKIMVGDNEAAADLLRKVVFEVQIRPGWDGSTIDRQAIGYAILDYLYPEELRNLAGGGR